ncbi:hypothetical protein GCM10027610_129380 [Dactylosporangium cerinum]
MPIVFVHGVANRDDDWAYQSDRFARDALFQRYVHPAAGISTKASVLSPYWGGRAATFRYDHVSLPDQATLVEDFGGEDADELALAAHLVEPVADPSRLVVEVARRSTADAADLLLTFTGLGVARDERSAQAFAELAFRVTELVPVLDASGELRTAKDDDEALGLLIRRLEVSAAPAAGSDESFGGADWYTDLGEGLMRLRNVAGRLTGRAVMELTRASMHKKVALFLGDVLTYVNKRGTADDPGPIPRIVGDEISAARRDGEPLIVVAHSMGGNIVYDVLSYFRPDLQVDVLVTVGSQVGLFAELGLLRVQEDQSAPAGRLRLPGRTVRWLNVLDLNDALAFATDQIFDGAKDTPYSTGRGLLAAHAAYFRTASFYQLVARYLER